MIKKTLLIFLNVFTLITILAAQSPIERRNRIVYNRIEYFFNLKQTDSIYSLASENFKNNIDLNSFNSFIEPLYELGQIKNAQVINFSNNTAGYNIEIGETKSSLHLAVDSNFQYDFLKIELKPIATRKVDDINSNVNNKNAIDLYIDSIAKSYLTNANTKSLSIGIYNKNTVNTFFYGQTDAADSSSIPNLETLYEIGSISKIFTATLLANLVENGQIDLEDSIINYLPDSLSENEFLQSITFKQLANHTSGLPRLPDNLDTSSNFNKLDPYANYTRKELFTFLKNFKGNSEPGENYEYSNLGYGLLGELISIITKKPYSDNIKEIISEPLGMPNTVQTVNPKIHRVAKVYNDLGEEVMQWNFQALAGAGSLKSTIHDLLRFNQFQFKLPETSLEKAMMLTREFTYYLPPNTDIGLAWHMNMVDDVIQYWHNGATGGSSSFIGLIPDKKSAIIVLSNSSISVDEISENILRKIATQKD